MDDRHNSDVDCVARARNLIARVARGVEPREEEATPRSVETNYAGSLVIVGGGGLADVLRDHFLKLAGGKKG
jgi:hypothetical protein